MAEPDIYSLLMGDEPTAQEQARALADALRQKRQTAAGARGLSMVASLGQNPLLQGIQRTSMQVGDSAGMEAQRGQGLLADAGQMRSGQRLQQLLQQRSQGFNAAEAEKDRALRQREGALGRGLQRELAGADALRSLAKLEADKKGNTAKLTMDLRKELSGLPQVKAFNDVSVAFDKIQKAAKVPSAAGDLSLIFAYMKLLDPGSTVREGEFANAQNATGVPGQVLNMYNRALKGERLAPEQRADFLGQAQNLYGAHEEQVRPLFERYRGLAEKAGATPDDVTPGLPETEPPAPTRKKGEPYQENGKWYVEE